MPADTFHDLATMIQYLDTQCASLTDLVREIEEIQREFETRFVGTQQEFENAKASAAAWVAAHNWQQPSWLIEASTTASLPSARPRPNGSPKSDRNSRALRTSARPSNPRTRPAWLPSSRAIRASTPAKRS